MPTGNWGHKVARGQRVTPQFVGYMVFGYGVRWAVFKGDAFLRFCSLLRRRQCLIACLLPECAMSMAPVQGGFPLRLLAVSSVPAFGPARSKGFRRLSPK